MPKRLQSAARRRNTARLLAAMGLTALPLCLLAPPALADGGAGGGLTGGAGGTGFSGDDGDDGAVGGNNGGGGGGGAGGGNGGDGANGGQVNPTGGAGGTAANPDGQNGQGGGAGAAGGGGGGGWNGNDPAGQPGTGQATLSNVGTLTGGKGGSSSFTGDGGGGGGGGAGGFGAIVTGTGASSNSGGIAGGDGGNGGGALDNGGGGGDGGEGVRFTATGATFINSGTVTGGDGGAGGIGDSTFGSNGAGGAGIVGAGLNIINSGLIQGGLSGDGVTMADPITFTGGVNRLELQVGSNIAGNVAAFSASDTLALGGETNSTFDVSQIGASAKYQGFGNFAKTGGSTWTLIGTNTGVLPWTINDGTLVVNTPLANSSFTVNGGALGGTGTIGGLTVNNGGTYAPGNSIGTQTVNGNLILKSGAIFEAEVNAAGQSDTVIVTGTVNLTGATLKVLAANGNYRLSTSYTIIDKTSAGAVSGQFGAITTNLAFLSPSVNYQGGDGNDVVLTLINTTNDFCSAAKTRNQCHVANALDQFPTDDPLFLAVLFQTADGARQAFDALSGEIHATLPGVLADDSRYVREAVLARLTQASHTGGGDTQVAAFGAGGPQTASLDSSAMALGYEDTTQAFDRSPIVFWTRGFGAWGAFDGNSNAASADRDLGGFISGMDANVGGSWRAGIATGASFSNVEVDARTSSADVESYHLGGYLGGLAGPLALRGGGMWAWNDIDTSRAVIFPGFFERQTASYDADTGQLFGEIAYPTQMGSVALEPFAGLAYVAIDTERFREHGGTLASLRGDADQNVGYSTVGLRAATTMHWGSMLVVPHVSAAWQHAFDDVTPGASLAFATTGIGFGIEGVPLAEDTALIDAGLDLALGERTTAGLSYTGQFGDGVADNGVKGRFTWLF